MANDTTKVTAGAPKIGGYAFMAAVGTALPEDATTALAATYTGHCLGYISEDGLTETPNMESTDIRDWGGDVVLSPLTSKSTEWSATFIESLNQDVLKMVYGDDNVTLTNGALAITGNSDELDPHVFVFEMKLTGDVPYRVVIPNGKITNIAETTYNRSSAVGYNVTIKALPDSNGNTFYKYGSLS